MIPVKEAVARAIEFAQSMLQPPAGSEILLEEVELGKHGPNDIWAITLSLPDRTGLSIFGLLQRDYKTFLVRADTGEVVAMKIREPATAQ